MPVLPAMFDVAGNFVQSGKERAQSLTFSGFTMSIKPRDELPPTIQGPSAWYGPSMAERRDWIEHLTDDQIADVESATRALTRIQTPIPSIRRRDFPLPSFGPHLRRILEGVL